MEIINPPQWPRPKGYSNAIQTSGKLLHTAGVIGWNGDEVIEHDHMLGQFAQALENIKAILAHAGLEPEHMVRMTWYVTDMQDYRDNLSSYGQVYRDIMGKVYPTMACIGVSSLVEERAKIEIEVTAEYPA